ncbi:MAG TPA: HIT family protein [Coriobacteriia bacterium]|jgi:histidine triad (HIT) family protein
MPGSWVPSDFDPDCPFCAITHGEDAADIVYADELAVAFLDRRPLFPGHVLLAPRAHVPTLADLPDDMVAPLFTLARAMSAAVRIAMEGDGSFLAVNDHVSQSVPHLHVHVVPRRYHDGLRGFFWPRHAYASDAERETVRLAVAEAVRTVLGRSG